MRAWPVRWGGRMGGTGARQRIGDQGVHGFARVGYEPGDVDEGSDFLVGAGLGEDGAP